MTNAARPKRYVQSSECWSADTGTPYMTLLFFPRRYATQRMDPVNWGKVRKNFMLSLLLMLKIALRMQVSHSTVSRWWMKRPSRTPWVECRASQTERTKLYTRDCPVVNQFHSIRYP
jgi:hypothetical protein